MNKTAVKLHNDCGEAVEFLCLEILGNGHFSSAFSACRKSDGLEVILKKMTPLYPTKEDAKRFRDAYELQVKLLNATENTAAPVIGYYRDEAGVPWIALHKMNGATLEKTDFQNLQDLFIAFYRITNGVGQIHDVGYLMLDLTPSNVFVLSDKGSMEGCYFFDFDSFILKKQVADLKWIHSTRGFLAPEITAFQETAGLSEAADMYGLGASLYWCLTGKIPDAYSYLEYSAADLKEEYRAVYTKRIHERLKTLFYCMLHPQKTERLSDWKTACGIFQELIELSDPNNRVRLCTNVPLDPGKFYIPTPAPLRQLTDFFLPRLGQRAYGVITGLSGCGKTTLAKAFAAAVQEHYDSIQFCHYLPGSGLDAILEQISADNCPDDERNKQLLHTLRYGQQKTLIIIDNFDREISPSFLEGMGKQTHILFTSRSQVDSLEDLNPCIQVPIACTPELARKIFSTVYSQLSGEPLTQKQKEIAFSLLEEFGNHTYATELLARELAQHYPTEEGFANFEENKHRLWQASIVSRKDRQIGQAPNYNTYEAYIELLFTDLLTQSDPVEIEVLFLFALERVWLKKLFFLLVGDQPETGRFRGRDAVNRLIQRGYISETGWSISIHSLVHQTLQRQASFDEDKLLWLFLGNFYAGIGKNDVPRSFSIWPDRLKEKMKLLVWRPDKAHEPLAMVHQFYSDPPMGMFWEKLIRLPHKKRLLARRRGRSK